MQTVTVSSTSWCWLRDNLYPLPASCRCHQEVFRTDFLKQRLPVSLHHVGCWRRHWICQTWREKGKKKISAALISTSGVQMWCWPLVCSGSVHGIKPSAINCRRARHLRCVGSGRIQDDVVKSEPDTIWTRTQRGQIQNWSSESFLFYYHPNGPHVRYEKNFINPEGNYRARDLFKRQIKVCDVEMFWFWLLTTVSNRTNMSHLQSRLNVQRRVWATEANVDPLNGSSRRSKRETQPVTGDGAR